MNPAPIPPELRAAAPLLAVRLGMILAGLAALIARAFLKHPRHVAVILPLWARLTRAARRFERLMARLTEGKTPRPSRPGHSGPPPTPLPTAHGWLVVALRHEAAAYACQLEAFLAEPQTAALIAHSPQAGRILRPLCRMLGLPQGAATHQPPAIPPTPPEPPTPPPAAFTPAPTLEPPCPRARWPWFARHAASLA